MAFTNCISSPTRSVLGCAGARCSSAPVRGGLPGPNRPVAHSQSHPNPPIEFIASKKAPNKARTMLQMVWYRRLVCTKYDSPDFLADPSVSMSSDHIYPPNVFRSVVTELSIQLLPTPPHIFFLSHCSEVLPEPDGRFFVSRALGHTVLPTIITADPEVSAHRPGRHSRAYVLDPFLFTIHERNSPFSLAMREASNTGDFPWWV